MTPKTAENNNKYGVRSFALVADTRYAIEYKERQSAQYRCVKFDCDILHSVQQIIESV